MAVDLTSLIVFLLIGLIAGWLADMLVKGVAFGLVGDLVVGVIGAFIGGWLLNTLGIFPPGSFIGPVIAAFVGAVILLLIIRLFNRSTTTKTRT